MFSNYFKGAILFTGIYCLILVLSMGLIMSRPEAILANPQIANAIVVNSTPAKSSFNIMVLVLELFIVTGIAIAEMKFKIITRGYLFFKDLFKSVHPLLITFMEVFIVIALAYLSIVFWGFASFIFLSVNGAGILLVARFILHKVSLKTFIPVAVTFLSFFILWPYILLYLATTPLSLLIMEFLYLPLTFLISALIMKYPTKNKINVIAFSFSVLLPSFIGTLFTPVFAVILLIIFAVYDFIAVFITHHMQFMAQRLLTMGVPEAFMLGSEQLIEKRLANLGKGQNPDTVIHKNERPLIFGVGDAVLPGILIASFVFAGLDKFAVLITLGCIVGVVANLFILSKKRIVLPALPLICLSIMIFLGIGLSVGV